MKSSLGIGRCSFFLYAIEFPRQPKWGAVRGSKICGPMNENCSPPLLPGGADLTTTSAHIVGMIGV